MGIMIGADYDIEELRTQVQKGLEGMLQLWEACKEIEDIYRDEFDDLQDIFNHMAVCHERGSTISDVNLIEFMKSIRVPIPEEFDNPKEEGC